MSTNSAALLNLACSLYHPLIIEEAKLNIKELKYFFKNKGITYDVLLDLVEKYDSDRLGKGLISTELSMRGNKSIEEVDQIINKVELVRAENDEIEVDKLKNEVKRACYAAVIEEGTFLYKEDLEKYKEHIAAYEYKDLGFNSYKLIDITTLDASSLMEKYLNKAIPSSLQNINLSYAGKKGYLRGSLVMVIAPPKCLHGDTEVMIPDGSVKSLKELYESKAKDISVYSYDQESDSLKLSSAEECILTKYTNQWIVLNIDSKEYKVTPDHIFYLVDGTEIEAKDLKPGDSLLPYNSDNRLVISSRVELLSEPEPCYDLKNVWKYHNFAVNYDDNSGFFVHNCGKSMFLMQEAAHFVINQGLKVNYLAIGDLNPLDFMARMSSQVTHTDLDVTYADVKSVQEKFNKILKSEGYENGGRLDLTVLPAGELTASTYAQVAKTLLKNHDVLIIDYDYNFKHENSSMYERGGELYNLLAKIKAYGDQLILVASQPSKYWWKEEILDETCAGESSMKQMIVDTMITIGRNYQSGVPCGYFNVALQRRGQSYSFPYIRSTDGFMNEVSDLIYSTYRHDPTKRWLSYKEVQLAKSLDKE